MLEIVGYAHGRKSVNRLKRLLLMLEHEFSDRSDHDNDWLSLRLNPMITDHRQNSDR